MNLQNLNFIEKKRNLFVYKKKKNLTKQNKKIKQIKMVFTSQNPSLPTIKYWSLLVISYCLISGSHLSKCLKSLSPSDRDTASSPFIL